MYKVIVFSFLAMLSIPASAHPYCNYHEAIHGMSREEYFELIRPTPGVPITIMVHGTGIFRRYFPLLREQSCTPMGIHPLHTVSNFYKYARLARHLNKAEPEKFPEENFYMFGWSGALCFKEREIAGAEFYKFLSYLKNDPELKDTPVTVITISHGGGVALNVAVAAEKHGPSDRILIDRLIMLCCPIQEATQGYAASPIFRKVIHCYSKSDFVQIIDPQGLYNYGKDNWKWKAECSVLSDRIISCPGPNTTQVEICSSRCFIGHIDFVLSGFYARLPRIVDLIENQSERVPKNRHGFFCIDINKIPY